MQQDAYAAYTYLLVSECCESGTKINASTKGGRNVVKYGASAVQRSILNNTQAIDYTGLLYRRYKLLLLQTTTVYPRFYGYRIYSLRL